MVNKEKVNEEVEPDQVYIKITGSEQVKALQANYIKWYLTYEQGKPAVEDHFNIKADE